MEDGRKKNGAGSDPDGVVALTALRSSIEFLVSISYHATSSLKTSTLEGYDLLAAFVFLLQYSSVFASVRLCP